MLVNPHLLPPSPHESISCDGCIFPLRSCFWPRCRHFPCPPWCICCGNNLDCLPFLLWSTFAFQAALPSDTSNQQHAAFVCIPACVPPGHHSSEKPLAHIPGILSFSLLSTLHQVSKFIVFVGARFTFFLLYVGVRRLPAQNLLMALGVQTHAFKQGFLVFIPRSFLKKLILPSGRVSISLSACGPAVMHHGPVLLMFWVTFFCFLYSCVFTQILSSPFCWWSEKQLVYLLTVAGADSYFWNKMKKNQKKNKSWRVAVLSQELTECLHTQLCRDSAGDDTVERRLCSALPLQRRKTSVE